MSVDTEDYVTGSDFTDYIDGSGDRVENGLMLIHCVGGDEYSAWFEDGAWWLLFVPGDPSEGPFATPEDVIDRLNTGE